MSLAYFPMFPADFEADTSHLTLEEDGAFNRLLRICWLTPGCSIPDDPAWIARRMRVDLATFDRVVSPVLREFFKRRSGRLYSRRLLSIWQETDAKHKRRVEAGRKGGRPRKSLETKESDQSNAKAMAKQPEPEPEPEPYKSLDDGDTGAGATVTGDPKPLQGPDELTFRERLLIACGVHPMQPAGTIRGRALGDSSDMATVRRYLAAGVSEAELIQIFADAAQRKGDGPPGSFAYFEQPVRRYLAARDAAPPEPSPGYVNGSRPSKPAPERVDVREALNGKPH